MIVNLPNGITLVRLMLAIVFFCVVAQYTQRDPTASLLYVALATFIVAAATDFLDGYYARKRDEVTAFGRVLDPFVDKVLVCGAFIFLAGPGFCTEAGVNVTGLKPWMVVLILGRELLVTGLRGFFESRGTAFGAEFVGKAKMWIQSITVGVLLLATALSGEQPGRNVLLLNAVFVWLTIVVTSASLVTYLAKSRAVFAEASR